MSSSSSPKSSAWFLLILLSLVWGSSFILMKRGLEAFSSDEVAGLRIVIASAFLLPFLIKHYKINFRKYLPGLLLMSVFGNLLPAFLFTKAETEISSSLTGMLNALTPLFTIIIGLLFFRLHSNKWQITGVITGFLGALLLLIFSPKGDETKHAIYCLLVVVATLFYAISVNSIRRYLSDLNSITATIWGFTIIGPMALIYLIGFTDTWTHLTTHPKGWSSLGYISILGIIGSAISVMLYNRLIKQAGAVFASSCTYLIPVVAIGWGILDGETVNLWQLLAILVIIGGVKLINKK